MLVEPFFFFFGRSYSKNQAIYRFFFPSPCEFSRVRERKKGKREFFFSSTRFSPWDRDLWQPVLYQFLARMGSKSKTWMRQTEALKDSLLRSFIFTGTPDRLENNWDSMFMGRSLLVSSYGDFRSQLLSKFFYDRILAQKTCATGIIPCNWYYALHIWFNPLR